VGQRRAADAPPPPPAPDPEQVAVAGTVAKSVQAAVDDLPAAQREAVLLAYFDGD
jgi:DNA-directed RNA polymerase specialized sigma24 family protein